MDSLRDIHYAFRSLANTPGFTAIALLALALGIGANTAIFSVVSAVLLRPLPYKDADRLVMVWSSKPQTDSEIMPVSPPDYTDWKNQNHVFEEMAISSDSIYSLTGMGDPEQIIGYRFSSNFFDVMGVKPLIGRTFLREEEHPGNNNVVVLSYRLWQRLFGGDPEIMGKPIILSGDPYTVIGVMPPAFRHPQMVELWTPLAIRPATMANRNATILRVVARLRTGVSIKQAQTEMDSIAHEIELAHPETNTGLAVKVVGLQEMYTGDIRPALLVLLAAVGFVLLIACANVANLLLVRSSSRQKEVAIRVALGATRLRLLRQMLTESLLLSAAGGGLGLALTFAGVKPLVAIFPNNIANLNIPIVERIPVDAKVLGFALVVSLLTGLVFGTVPSLKAARPDVNEGLKDTGRTSTASRGRRFRGAMAICEIALALVLLIGAGLMIRSFVRLQAGNLGFDPQNVLSLEAVLPQNKYAAPEKRQAFVEQVLQRLESLPGVRSAAATNFLPLSGFWGTVSFTVDGRPLPAPGEEPKADFRVATPRYFQTMLIPLLKGREFTNQDNDKAPDVAVVNETLARRLWPEGNAVGSRINIGDANRANWLEIVGIVGDVKSFGLEKETHSDVYTPYNQNRFSLVAFVIRTAGDPMSLVSAAKSEIWSVDKDQPVFKVVSMSELAAESVSLRRISMLLLAIFAAVAMLLAALGIYGVMAYSVAQRSHEIGIRMALGAARSDVLRLVLKEALLLTGIGLACGLGGALALTRLMVSVLYRVSATDPGTYFALALFLTIIAVLASYLPARRATAVDPMIALRYE
jgi:putative ABC transport system permease protein